MIDTLLKIQTLNGITPSIIDEVSPSLTYIGYLNPQLDITDQADLRPLAIKKIEKVGGVTTTKWTGGSQKPDFTTKWSDRATATYSF